MSHYESKLQEGKEELKRLIYKKGCAGEIYATGIEIETFFTSFASSIKAGVEEDERKAIEKWVFDNHSHHEFADEILPKGLYGCDERNHPYVNSQELLKFLTQRGENAKQ